MYIYNIFFSNWSSTHSQIKGRMFMKHLCDLIFEFLKLSWNAALKSITCRAPLEELLNTRPKVEPGLPHDLQPHGSLKMETPGKQQKHGWYPFLVDRGKEQLINTYRNPNTRYREDVMTGHPRYTNQSWIHLRRYAWMSIGNKESINKQKLSISWPVEWEGEYSRPNILTPLQLNHGLRRLPYFQAPPTHVWSMV